MPQQRRFPLPWTVDELTESFVIKDGNGPAASGPKRKCSVHRSTPSFLARLSAPGPGGHHATGRPARSAAVTAKLTLHVVPSVGAGHGLALAYLGIVIADQSIWALIIFPVVLIIIQHWAIEPEEAFLERRFGTDYSRYKANVRRWL